MLNKLFIFFFKDDLSFSLLFLNVKLPIEFFGKFFYSCNLIHQFFPTKLCLINFLSFYFKDDLIFSLLYLNVLMPNEFFGKSFYSCN